MVNCDHRGSPREAHHFRKKGGGSTLEVAAATYRCERISPLNRFSGASCSINWLRTEINPPSRHWRTLEHHQTPKALDSHRRLALHISLTPRSLRCPSLLTSPTLKSPWMSLLTSLTKAYSRGAKGESCSCRCVKDLVALGSSTSSGEQKEPPK
jgi:hypothetical protein